MDESSEHPTRSLTSLPLEIRRNVFDFLDFESLSLLRATCRELREAPTIDQIRTTLIRLEDHILQCYEKFIRLKPDSDQRWEWIPAHNPDHEQFAKMYGIPRCLAMSEYYRNGRSYACYSCLRIRHKSKFSSDNAWMQRGSALVTRRCLDCTFAAGVTGYMCRAGTNHTVYEAECSKCHSRTSASKDDNHDYYGGDCNLCVPIPYEEDDEDGEDDEYDEYDEAYDDEDKNYCRESCRCCKSLVKNTAIKRRRLELGWSTPRLVRGTLCCSCFHHGNEKWFTAKKRLEDELQSRMKLLEWMNRCDGYHPGKHPSPGEPPIMECGDIPVLPRPANC